MTNKTGIKIIMALALPTMLEQLMQTAVQYIDTAMVGSLGTNATAAVGSTTTVNWLVGSSISALAIGFLAYIAKALGGGDADSAKKASAQSVFAVLVTGALFTALTLSLSGAVPVLMQVAKPIQKTAAKYFFILYLPMLPRTASTIFGTVLRAAGDSKTPMQVGVLVNVTNVLLNLLLIYPTHKFMGVTVFGAGLGVMGAAIASAIAFTLGGALITIKLFCHKTISPKGYSIKPDKSVLAPCLKVAIPNMLQRFATSLGYVAFASMINSLGAVSTAAHTIANTVESVFYIPGYGMQTASATLAGNANGAKDPKMLNSNCKTIVAIETVLMIISGGLLFVFARPLVSLFSKTPAVIALGSTVLKMVALSEPFYGVSIVLEGMLQGLGNTKAPFVFNIIGMWGIRIIGTFLCISLFNMGLVSAWTCMILHNLFLFLAFALYSKNLLKKRLFF